LLTGPTLTSFENQGRLLTAGNSNGFIPGEAASAILVARATSGHHLQIDGLGFATENAAIDKEEPLRGDGLMRAILASLRDAGRAMHEMDFRIVDVSGEQFYFKEAALALARTMHVHKEEFDIWHPAESIGETGSAVGPALIAVAAASAKNAYAPGTNALFHFANDAGKRAAIVARLGRH
jgi:3-oxoacyl-[acyl-carrier-protein] synthase-1